MARFKLEKVSIKSWTPDEVEHGRLSRYAETLAVIAGVGDQL